MGPENGVCLCKSANRLAAVQVFFRFPAVVCLGVDVRRGRTSSGTSTVRRTSTAALKRAFLCCSHLLEDGGQVLVGQGVPVNGGARRRSPFCGTRSRNGKVGIGDGDGVR